MRSLDGLKPFVDILCPHLSKEFANRKVEHTETSSKLPEGGIVKRYFGVPEEETNATLLGRAIPKKPRNWAELLDRKATEALRYASVKATNKGSDLQVSINNDGNHSHANKSACIQLFQKCIDKINPDAVFGCGSLEGLAL